MRTTITLITLVLLSVFSYAKPIQNELGNSEYETPVSYYVYSTDDGFEIKINNNTDTDIRVEYEHYDPSSGKDVPESCKVKANSFKTSVVFSETIKNFQWEFVKYEPF